MLRDSALSLLSTGVRLLTSLGLFVVLAHVWGPATFGLFMFFYALAAVLGRVVDYGFTLQVATDIGRAPERAHEIVGRMLGAKLVLLVPTALTAAVVAVRHPTAGAHIALLVLLLADALVASFALFLNIPLRSLGKFGREAQVNTWANVALFVTTMLAMRAGAGPGTMAVVFLGCRSVFLLLAWRAYVTVVGQTPRPLFERQALRRTLSTGFPFAIHTAIATLSLQSDTLMIQHYLGASAVGLHQAGMRLLFGALLVGDALHNVFFASLARAVRDRDRLRQLATRMTRHFSTLGVLGYAALAGIGHWLVSLLFADAFAPLGRIVPLFGLLVLVRYAGLIYGGVLTLAERQGLRVLASCGDLALTFTLDVLLIPRLGIPGALIASILSQLVLHAMCATAAWADYRDTLIDRRTVVLLLVTAGATPVLVWPAVSPGIRLAVSVALALTALGIGVLAEERRHLLSIVRGRLAPFLPQVAATEA